MGCFSPKSPPGDANQSFAKVGGTNYTFIQIVSPFCKVLEKSNGRIKSYKQKVSFWTIWGFLGAFLTPFGPLGTRRGFSPKKNFLQCKTTYENTFCRKISGKSNGRFTGNKLDGRTHARTRLITIVPFRLKSGD